MGHMGTYMVHVLLHVSGLILHGAFQTKFLGILYHKLSTFVVIRRGAGCFKYHFWIFIYLEKFFYHDQGAIIVLWWGLSPIFLCYQLESDQILLTGERSYQWLKDATSFVLLSDKSAEIFKSKYLNICQFSILATWPTWSFVFVFICKWGCDITSAFTEGTMENFQIIKYFDSNYLALLSDNRANKVASCRYS